MAETASKPQKMSLTNSIRILKGFKEILKDFYKDFEVISKRILWRFNGILKDF